jgi:hypothetical protein
MQNNTHTTTTARLFRRAFTQFVIAFGLLATSAHAGPAFSEFVDPNPSPDNFFGRHIVPLSTGNVVITSPFADIGGTDTGAVYLFNMDLGNEGVARGYTDTSVFMIGTFGVRTALIEFPVAP